MAQKTSPRSIRRSVEFEALLRHALSLTPEIKGREKGWFARLMITILKHYIATKGATS